MSQMAARARATRRAGPGCRCGPQATPPACPCQAAPCLAPARGMPARAPRAPMASRPRWELDLQPCAPRQEVHWGPCLDLAPGGSWSPVQQTSLLAFPYTSTIRQSLSNRFCPVVLGVSRPPATVSGTTWLPDRTPRWVSHDGDVPELWLVVHFIQSYQAVGSMHHSM